MGDIPNPKDGDAGMEKPHVAGGNQPLKQLVKNTASESPVEPYRPPPPRQDSGGSDHHAFSSQFDMSHQAGPGRSGSFNMVQMANALPYNHYQPNQFQGQPQRYGQHVSPMMPAIGHASQFMGSPQEPIASQGYYMQPPQMVHFYAVDANGHQHMQPRQGMGYYAPQVMMGQPQTGSYYVHVSPYPEQHQQHLQQHQTMSPPGMPQPYGREQPTTTGRKPSLRPPNRRNRSNHDSRQAGENKNQKVVRGPPRKPRQSGHAIWIGNLPPQTELMRLVHHVCAETPGLQSLFLISKSNCAFANFKDEAACHEAQNSLHDSKFQSVRLVCRLRKNSVEGASGVAPTGPSNTSSPVVSDESLPSLPTNEPTSPIVGQQRPSQSKPCDSRKSQPNRFFILKSLTLEDLELSVRTGVWATQSHNEDALNNAFKTSENVYLVFSANKSGEYFGYARMSSEINQDPEAAIQFAPQTHDVDETQLAKEVPTEANGNTPKGRIVDDSARGTIFWEAEVEGMDGESDDDESEVASQKMSEPDEDMQTSGKPFNLVWLSTTRLPFYRTRGLRNPWNSNREVKIARDGTELEPATGQRLVGLFHYMTSAANTQRGSVAGYSAMGGYGI